MAIEKILLILHYKNNNYSLYYHLIFLPFRKNFFSSNKNENQKTIFNYILDFILPSFYFSHLFKQSIGMPPYQYLIQQRVESL